MRQLENNKYLSQINKNILRNKNKCAIKKIYKYLEDNMDNRLNYFVKAILDFCFYVGLVIEVSVPFTLKYAIIKSRELMGESMGQYPINEYYWYAVVSIMMAGVAALLILFELRKMMKTVIEDNCFVEANVKSLYRMGTYAFIITGVKLLRCFAYFTPGAVIIAGVFFFAGLFSKVLARVFDRAVSYKQENDLTI